MTTETHPSEIMSDEEMEELRQKMIKKEKVVRKTSQLLNKKEMDQLMKTLDDVRRAKPVKPRMDWMKRFKITKLEPMELKKMIERGVINSMVGKSFDEKQRRASLVTMDKLET